MKKFKSKKLPEKRILPKRNRSLKEIASVFNLSKVKSGYAGFGIILVINVSTIFRSSWAGDDWPNSQTPYWIQWRYGALTNWNIWTEAMFWNDQWMKGAGRFYPLTWIESRFAFSYLRELWQYKIYQVALLVIAGLLLTYVSYILSKSHVLALSTLACLSLTIQFRRDFDPHLAFAVMLPSLMIKVLIAIILAYKGGKSSSKIVAFSFTIASGSLYFAAMSTYEFGFLLFPLLVISFSVGCMERKDTPIRSSFHSLRLLITESFSIAFLPIFISWISYGLFVFMYLRPQASAISGSYVLGISWLSVKVFLSQLFTGIPLIAFREIDFSYNSLSFFLGLLLALLCYLLLKGVLRSIGSKSVRRELGETNPQSFMRNRVGILMFSIILIAAPGLMMAMQPTWWNRANLTHSYLGVMITEFGTAVMLSLLIERLLTQNMVPIYSKTRGKK